MYEWSRPPVELAADFHVHPDYSIDASGTIDEYCYAAISKMILEICFTTHYDADPQHLDKEGFIVINGNREKLSDDALDVYFSDIDRAHQEFGILGLMVRRGLEFGWFDGCAAEVRRVKSKFHLDYAIGGVHSIRDKCVCCHDSAPDLFKKMTLEQLADEYFRKLDEAASSGVFDCLAHIDVYRKYGLEYYGDDILTIHRGRIEKVFETMKKHNVGYEINTSAIRHGHSEYYPTMEIVNLAREMGVPLRSVGSDAHSPEQLGLDFETASCIAYELFPYVDE